MTRHLRNTLILLLLIAFPVTACACDDTVLRIISGKNPSDEFSAALLSMVRDLQQMASAINAYDVETASQRMDSAMSGWLDFSSRYRVSPPPGWENNPQWDVRLMQTADLLGRLRNHFTSGRPKASHDMIEGIATQMTLLSTRAAGIRQYEPFLEAEWELLGLNPSLPENARDQEMQTRISSFSATIRALHPSIPPEAGTVYSQVEKAIAGLRNASLASPRRDTPIPIRAYADLLAAFNQLTGFIWKKSDTASISITVN